LEKYERHLRSRRL